MVWAWEQGINAPNAMACRFLDEIRRTGRGDFDSPWTRSEPDFGASPRSPRDFTPGKKVVESFRSVIKEKDSRPLPPFSLFLPATYANSDGMPAHARTIASDRDGHRAADSILRESALLY
jgi:hypothetical protein